MYFIKSEKALRYCDTFNGQCPVLDDLIEEDVVVDITIYYASRRPDLDESLILDLLQGKVYKNDRQVKEKHIRWGLDPKHPRSIITVKALESGAGTGGA
jgi:Holliday junction resolvase RusA-like endonuclease